MEKTITVLGINGHAGRFVAAAFAEAGWTVRGFGRSNRYPQSGVEFVGGDADNPEDLVRAIEGSAVVFNGIHPPYDKWFGGRMEEQTSRVLEAARRAGVKTFLYPGNIYNYAASDRVVTPDLPQRPETPRGAVRVRTEKLLEDAAKRGEMQIIIQRAGDFYGPGNVGDWHDLMIMREAGKGKVTAMSNSNAAHAWAYLPDLARAFVRLAEIRDTLGAFESFHFAGHYVTSDEMIAAIRSAAPVPLREVPPPLTLLRIVGIFDPIMREVLKMRYLWETPMALRDERLDAILGKDFGTPFEDAIAELVAPFFKSARKKAA